MNRSAAIAASAAVTGVGMIAFPLAGRGSVARRRISDLVVGGLATTTTGTVARRWGVRRAGLAGLVVAVGTAAVEKVGTATGVPFGRYEYAGRLRPTVLGVPLVVPGAWWAMAAPSREVAHAALGRHSTPTRRVVLGAVALTSWDLFLDPQMTAEGFWRWARGGRYRGIPLSNYAGWLLVSAAVMVVLEVILTPGRADPGLVGEYAAMGLMESVGFGVFFGDPLVAALGGAGMLPIGAVAVARVLDA